MKNKDSKKIVQDPNARYCPICGKYLTSFTSDGLPNKKRCQKGCTGWSEVIGYKKNISTTFAGGKTMMVFTAQLNITGAMPGYGPMPPLNGNSNYAPTRVS